MLFNLPGSLLGEPCSFKHFPVPSLPGKNCAPGLTRHGKSVLFWQMAVSP